MNRLLPLIKFFFSWPLSILALLFIIKLTLSNINNIQPYLHMQYGFLLGGIFFLLAYFFLRTYLWQQILKYHGYTLLFKEVSYLWGISELKRYIPGNIWALAGRTILFSEKQIPKKTIFSSLIIESQLIILSSLVLSLISIDFTLKHLFPTVNTQPIVYILMFAVSVLLLFFIFHSYIIKQNKDAPPHVRKNILLHIRDVALSHFNAYTNFSLFLIGILAFLCFGLGTYLTISSVLILPSSLLILLLSFFVFSFLVGYLSFITPMGLGVREGAITWGLSQVMPLASVAFAGIFARIVLIVSELLFIASIALWRNGSKKIISMTKQFIIQHKYELLLFLITIGYIIYFTTASFLRFDNYYTGRFDLGNMDQVVWNTMRGRPFQLTNPNGTDIISRLSIHADVILVLLSPFYQLWSDPRMLLLIQTIVIALGSFFVYKIAREILNKKRISFLFSLAFLLSPSVGYANLYDFHPVALAITFLLAAFYFVLRKKYILFLAFAVLCGLTKENVWIPVSMLGLYIVIKEWKKPQNLKRILLGLTVFLVSIGIFYYLVWHAIPTARGREHFALDYYTDFGTNPTTIIKKVITSPTKTIQTIFTEQKLLYIHKLFSPLGYLPLMNPFFLIFALPDFFINLLSNNSQLYQIYFQYTTVITPFLFIAAIYGMRNISKIFSHVPCIFFELYLVIAILYGAYVFGPLPLTQSPNTNMFTKPLKNREFISTYLSKIPRRFSVAATNNVGSHLSHRQRIYTIPVGLYSADMVVFLLGDPFTQPSPQKQKEMISQLKTNHGYKIRIENGDFYVFEKIK